MTGGLNRYFSGFIQEFGQLARFFPRIPLKIDPFLTSDRVRTESGRHSDPFSIGRKDLKIVNESHLMEE